MFRAVSKTDRRDGFILDAFINGIILSYPIRQRLLEDAAFWKVLLLDIAQKNSEQYVCSDPCTPAATATQDEIKCADD